MAFSQETPRAEAFDLVVLTEVAYYWGLSDLEGASKWLPDHVALGGRVILVHDIERVTIRKAVMR